MSLQLCALFLHFMVTTLKVWYLSETEKRETNVQLDLMKSDVFSHVNIVSGWWKAGGTTWDNVAFHILVQKHVMSQHCQESWIIPHEENNWSTWQLPLSLQLSTAMLTRADPSKMRRCPACGKRIQMDREERELLFFFFLIARLDVFGWHLWSHINICWSAVFTTFLYQ